jgi:xanthine dehydrogenase accessory factor
VRREVDRATGAVTLAADAPDRPDLAADEATVAKRFGPVWRLLIVGAGQLAGYLSAYARDLAYGVTVCDPRPEADAQWTGPAELDARMPDDAVAGFAPDPRSAVVAATHDPKLDDLALLEALGSPAFYVGALGSRRNNDRRRERLRELGLAPAAVERLRGPMGLAIGSRTPPEIALAVAAEMTAVRHGRAVEPA